VTINVTHGVVISKPVSEVFAFVADHENLPKWTVGVRESQRLTPGPPATGSRYRVVGQLLGRSIESNYEITAFDHDRGFHGTMNSPMFSFSERYRFDPEGSDTRVSMSAGAQPHGIFRLLAPIMALGVRRQVKADHRRLKTLLELR
jgi:uncharacterized membrane protein